jgi:hypothetical protein
MDAPTIREKLDDELDTLSITGLERILKYVKTIKSMRLPDDYNVDNDPAVGFLSDSADLAERSKEILRKEFGLPRDQRENNSI